MLLPKSLNEVSFRSLGQLLPSRARTRASCRCPLPLPGYWSLIPLWRRGVSWPSAISGFVCPASMVLGTATCTWTSLFRFDVGGAFALAWPLLDCVLHRDGSLSDRAFISAPV